MTRLIILALAIALSGCTATCTALRGSGALLPVPPVPPKQATATAGGVAGVAVPAPLKAAVVKHFDAATSRELSAVMAPTVTVEQITRVHEADKAARAALRALGRQGRKASLAALDRARAAVRQLEAALDDAPGGAPQQQE